MKVLLVDGSSSYSDMTTKMLKALNVLGGISLLLGFYALGILSVNYAGILLLVLAVGLFIAGLFTASFGLLTAGGMIRLSARLSCLREEPCSE